MIAGTSVSTILLGWLLCEAGVRAPFPTLMWLSMPVALFVALLLAWPVARLFGVGPLMMFAGPCPGCRTRPPGWWAKETGAKRL